MGRVTFNATDAECEAVYRIAGRVVKIEREREGRVHRDRKCDIRMDLIACHSNGCPLDFEKLEGFDDFNLLHDVYGIDRHLNRETGALSAMFLPRCALSEKKDV
ncbi:DUF6874 family protein [Acetobacter sicerae]